MNDAEKKRFSEIEAEHASCKEVIDAANRLNNLGPVDVQNLGRNNPQDFAGGSRQIVIPNNVKRVGKLKNFKMMLRLTLLVCGSLLFCTTTKLLVNGALIMGFPMIRDAGATNPWFSRCFRGS